MQYGGVHQRAISPHAYNPYSTGPEDVAYGPRKRTHSMSEGTQNPGYAQCDELSERHQLSASTSFTNHGIVGHTQALQTPAAYQSQPLQQTVTHVDTTVNSQATHMAPKEIYVAKESAASMSLDVANARAGQLDNHMDVNLEWNEQSVDK